MRGCKGCSVCVSVCLCVRGEGEKRERERREMVIVLMIDGCSREEEEEEHKGERLNVSTWLLIQSDYHRLTALTSRRPDSFACSLLGVAGSESEHYRQTRREGRETPASVSVCVCVCATVRDESAVDESQTDKQPLLPHLGGAAQGTRGHIPGAACKTTPCAQETAGGGCSQPSRHWTRGWSRQQRKLSNQFQGGKERERKKKNTAKNIRQPTRPLFGAEGVAQTCTSVLKTIHYIDGGIQKYVVVATNSFS